MLWPAPARAHISLEWSSPAKDSVVSNPFTQLRLRFSGRVEPAYTSVRLLGPDGTVIALGSLAVVAGSDNREFVALPSSTLLAAGSYTVEWRTAGADGHVITGTFAFTVNAPAVPLEEARGGGAADTLEPAGPAQHHASSMNQPVPAPTSATAVGIRWLNFAALIGLVGGVVFRLGVLPRATGVLASSALEDAAARRTWRFVVVCSGLAVVALIARLWLQSASLHGTDSAWNAARLATMLSVTGWGKAWLLQSGATILLAISLLVTGRRTAGLRGWHTMALAVAALALVPALSGHAAAVQRFGTVAILSDTLHVLAAGAWIGTLAAVLFCGIPAVMKMTSDRRNDAVVVLVRGFSRIALVAVATIVVTGVVAALLHLNTPADFITTSYGRVLVLKLLVLAMVLGTGFYNWRFVQPALASEGGRNRLDRSAGVEITVGFIVIFITAVLVALPTP